MIQVGTQLKGVRVWLSGAVPPDVSEAQRSSILAFVAEFAAIVFRAGGHILHGSHPTITPTLLDTAATHVKAGGRRDCLTLAVSKYWSHDTRLVPVQDWREHCLVYETPEAKGESARDESLRVLREWMSVRCDAFIGLGGNWWHELPSRAGVPLEAGLAIERGLPCFLLGGLGGAAQDYLEKHPSLLQLLRNGLDPETNKRIATEQDVHSLVNQIHEQLSRLPLVRGRVSDGISFRILALDGGGIKGAFTASVLATLEKAIGEPIASHFDLVAGTSTGGILGIGLGMGRSPQEMLDFYRTSGPLIFPMTRLYRRWEYGLRQIFRPKHSQEVLMGELKKGYFPDGNERALGESTCRLVIPAYDATSGVCHIFRTPHHELLRADEFTNAAEVALATAAAPTYFSAAKVRNLISNSPYLDGGVWANCPAMAAIVEAVCYLGVPLDRIDVLSIGTTDEPFTTKTKTDSGFAGWGKTLIDLLMNAQVDSAIRHAQQLVGEPRFLRLNSTTNRGTYTLDNVEEIESLIALGNKRASDPSALYQVKSRFLNGVPAIDWKQGQ